jgi:hypothetical protein
MYCSNCGVQIDDRAISCPSCGVPTKNYEAQAYRPQTNAQPIVIHNSNVNTNTNASGATYLRKSKWVAFFLCLFLGYLGVHRFYVGKTGTGILWLFTGGFFAIGAIIDLIMILIGGFRDIAGQPLD